MPGGLPQASALGASDPPVAQAAAMPAAAEQPVPRSGSPSPKMASGAEDYTVDDLTLPLSDAGEGRAHKPGQSSRQDSGDGAMHDEEQAKMDVDAGWQSEGMANPLFIA